jgi:hypothetical protein
VGGLIRQREMGETMPAKPGSVSFEGTVAATGNNTGIVVPDEVIEQLAAGRRPPVLISLNGFEYRNTIGVLNGRHMISLTVADSRPEVTIPADFAAALAADEQAGAFFGGLSNSLQRYHIDSVASAKSADTRQRRIDKAIALFRAGKQR